MEVPTMVIKVKYQETLRRFNVRVTDDEIDLNMDRLWEKLLTLFNFNPDTELMLTYIDEDGDEVALVDDDDLRDVARQGLDPLRLTVKLNSEKNGLQYRPSGSSKSQFVQPTLQHCHKILKTVPEPVYETVVKLSSDLATKASSPASGVNQLIDYFSKVGLTYLAHCPDSQNASRTMTRSDVSDSREAARDIKNLELAKVDAAMLKAPSLTAPGFNDVALESQSISVGQPVIAESKVMLDKVSEKGKAMDLRIGKNGECHAKDKPFARTSLLPPAAKTECFIGKIGRTSQFLAENATNTRDPNLESYPSNFRASNHINGDHVGGRTQSLFPGSYGKSTGSIWTPYPRTSRFPQLCSGHSPADAPQFSRIPVANVSALRSHTPSKAVTSSGCNRQSVDTFHLFHCGIFCDGCGVHPITGPRFKSKVKENYDLCMICFAEMGKANDFIRIDHPVVYPHHVLYDSHASNMDTVSSQGCRGFKVKSCLSMMDSCLVKDVNIPDDTVMAPLTPFTKTWRLKNSGIVAWPKKTTIFWMGGDALSNEFSAELEIPATGLAINQELDVSVECNAPALPGKYDSCWGLASPSGQRFGQYIWIRIEVVASVGEKPLENVRSFNLNLPPHPETVNAVPASIVESRQNEPENNNSTSVEPSSVLSPTAPVSYHFFDHLNVAPAFRSISSDVLRHFTPLPDINSPASEEGLSFKSADLDDDSVDLDDVSEFSDWDSILDELSDMGFYDIEMNRTLLAKNNGNIEPVVMELIAAGSK